MKTITIPITDKEFLVKRYGCPPGHTWHEIIAAGLEALRTKSDADIEAFINTSLE
jgi:hypothetical protein